MAKPPSADDRQRLLQRASALEALYAGASSAQTAEFAARSPNLPSLVAMAPALQDCALMLYAYERQALWAGAPREMLMDAFVHVGEPLRASAGNAQEITVELRLRDALMHALASLMTPGQRMAALDEACRKPWPGLGDVKATASRDLLRRTFWSLFDVMNPEELAHAEQKLAALKRAFEARVGSNKAAPGNAAEADRLMLLGHALAQSRTWRSARPRDDLFSDAARTRLVEQYRSQPDSREEDFDTACNPEPLLRLEPDSLEPTLQLQVLTTLMTPERRLLSLVHAHRQHTQAAAERTPLRQDPHQYAIHQRLMHGRLLALFNAMTPPEIKGAKEYLQKLDSAQATAPRRPSSPSLREQRAQASFLKLCDATLKAVLGPVRGR